MTSAIPYLDASSLPIEPSKTRYGDASATVSSRTPKIVKIEQNVRISDAARKHTEFDDFMNALETNPVHAKGFAEARIWAAEALYGDEQETIKTLRLKAGMTQIQLAVAMETSQPQIAKIESGRHDPAMSTCRRLSRVLGVSLDAISAALEHQAEMNEQKVAK